MVSLRGESLTHHTNQMKLFNAIAVATVIGTSFIATRPALAECRADGVSIPSQRPVQLSVTNNRNYPVKLIWIDFDGSRKLYDTIASGDTILQPTYDNHLWVIEEDGSNICLTNIRPGASNQALTLR